MGEGQRRHSNSYHNKIPLSIKYIQMVLNMVYCPGSSCFLNSSNSNLSRLNRMNLVFSKMPHFTVWLTLVLGEVILFPAIFPETVIS